jgi:hypothetical protein
VYEIVEASTNGGNLFFIEPSTGKIITKSPVTTDYAPVNNYNVSSKVKIYI